MADLTPEEKQELSNEVVRGRAAKHFKEGEKKNYWPVDCPEYKAYNDRWEELESEDGTL